MMSVFETINDLTYKRPISSVKRKGVVKACWMSVLNHSDTRVLQEREFKNVAERKKVMKDLMGVWGKSISFFQIEFK